MPTAGDRVVALQTDTTDTWYALDTEASSGGSTFPITYDDGTYTYSITAASGLLAVDVVDDATGAKQSRVASFQGTDLAATVNATTATKQAFVQPYIPAAAASFISLGTDAHNASLQIGTTNPNGVVSLSKGSLFIDNTAPALYQNTNGSTAWSAVGGGAGFPIQYDDGTTTYDISADSPDPHGGWSSGSGYMLFDVHDNSDPLASAGIIGLGPGDFQVDANTVTFNTGIDGGNYQISNSSGMNLIYSGGHTEIVAGNGSSTGRILTLKAGNGGKIVLNAHGHDVTIGNTDTANVMMRQYASGADPAAPIRSGADAWGRFYMRDNGAGKMQFCVRFPTGAIQVIATEP